MREIRVKLYREINDYCNELWVDVDSPKRYYNRMVHHGIEEWFTSSDAPNGYCESNYSLDKDVVFIICDDKKNEIARSGNGKFEGKTILRTICEEFNFQYKEYLKKCSETEKKENSHSFYSWILSFMTPELCKEHSLDYSYNCTEDNWIWFWNDTIKSEKVYEFSRLGKQYIIAKDTVKHKYGPVEWFQMVVYTESEFKKPNEPDQYRTGMILDTVFDDSVMGTMVSSFDARELLENALKEIYQINDYRIDKLHYIYSCDGLFPYEKKLELRQAADIIMPKERYASVIPEVIEKEKANHTFFNTWEEVKEKVPNCKQDYSF